MLYNTLKALIRFSLHLYYSEIKVRNKHHLNHDGPVIIIANHPNALIDAWLIGTIFPKPTYYMTKATFFNSKLKMKLLRGVNMIPINRATEGKIQGVDNNSSFEECFALLSRGDSLVVFPEGNSQMELFLRKLKSGTARIALEAEERNNGNLNLKIVPMGLFYTKGEEFRSSVFVNCGEGMSVTDYLDEFKNDNIQTAKKLTEKFREILENVLVTTQNKEQEELIVGLSETLHSRYLNNSENVESEVELIKKVRDRIEKLSIDDPEKIIKIQDLYYNLKWKIGKEAIKDDFLDRGIRSTMFIRQLVLSMIGIVIGLPFFVFGVIHNFLQYQFISYFVEKKITDKEFVAPVSILMSMILYPIVYLLFMLLIYKLYSPAWWVMILYFIAMPVTGFFAHFFVDYFKHIIQKWNFVFLIMKNKNVIMELKQQRQELFQLIFED